MELACRLCGLEKSAESCLELKDERVQELFRKCNVYQCVEENKLMPQAVCSECHQVLLGFEKFLCNVVKVQLYLSVKLKHQLEVPFQVKIEECDYELDMEFENSPSPGSDSPSPSKRHTTRRKADKKKSKKSVKVLKDPFDDTKPRRIMPRRPKKVKENGELEENAMEKVFEKELKHQIFDFPVESLNVADGEKNEDGSLTELGLERYGTFKWSNFLWSCDSCDKSFKNVADLRRHYRHDHDLRPFFRCPDCPKKFRILPACVSHYFEHCANAKFCCWFCDKYYCDVLQLYRHQVKDHKYISKLCLYCGRHFYMASDLREHRETHSLPDSSLTYMCDVCHKVFKTKQTLRGHMIIHLDIREHICEICGKDFPKKQYLDSHMLFHQDSFAFRCDICDKGCKTSGNLIRHKATHKTVKDIICSICGKAFNAKPALKNHLRVHSDEMPYECEFCGKRFKHHSTFKDHRRLHTGERPYACTECPSTFAGYPNFSKHMKTHGIDVAKKNRESKAESLAKWESQLVRF